MTIEPKINVLPPYGWQQLNDILIVSSKLHDIR